MNKTTEERFWEKVKVIDDETSCWEWQAGLNPTGYGGFSINSIKISAHRFSWELANNSKIPKNLVIRHSCHNPQCVRPEHLSTGTHQDNKDDCVKADRQAKGEGHGNVKLTEEQVEEVRLLRSQSEITITELGIKYGVSKEMIRKILKGENWTHLPNEHGYVSKSDHVEGEEHRSAKLTADKVREIRSLYSKGVTCQELATLYGVSHPSMTKVVKNRSWKHVTP